MAAASCRIAKHVVQRTQQSVSGIEAPISCGISRHAHPSKIESGSNIGDQPNALHHKLQKSEALTNLANFYHSQSKKVKAARAISLPLQVLASQYMCCAGRCALHYLSYYIYSACGMLKTCELMFFHECFFSCCLLYRNTNHLPKKQTRL